MLDPQQREIYLDALRPPDGFHLDRAIATTYTLDLTALLVVPLSMALFPCESGETVLRDPVAVLEALRRNADRITVFCQRGAIKVPNINHLLYNALESIVVEVELASGRAGGLPGVFHPKIWLLRFEDEAQRIHYRLLCLSRNLTFDRSWDTLFVIEGALESERDPIERNAPLAAFVAALPGLATDRLEPDLEASIARIGDEILRTDLRLPPDSPFDDASLRFHALGIGLDSGWPFPEPGSATGGRAVPICWSIETVGRWGWRLLPNLAPECHWRSGADRFGGLWQSDLCAGRDGGRRARDGSGDGRGGGL